MCDANTKAEIDEIKKSVAQNNRALRGSNGDPGLVAEVRELSHNFDRLVENDLPHMKDDILDEIKKLHDKSITWPALGKGLVGPIIISVITALLVTGLHRIFF